ncbi:MAG: hypothetical protein V1827_02140 [Candidatus Micrarchaeota archaeon]
MEEPAFREWLSGYTDADRCLAVFRSQKQFFRVNTLKMSVEAFMKRTKLRFTKLPFFR